MKDRCVFLKESDGIEYYLFTPSVVKLYDRCYEKQDRPPYYRRAVHKVRMVRECLRSKYRVVYMRSEGKTVGHLVVGRGGTRIAVSTADDIVIGPIWVIPSERGKGLATAGISFVLHELGEDYENAYEYIKEDNAASIKTVVHNDFELVERCSEFGLMRVLRKDADGDLLVYRYKNKR